MSDYTNVNRSAPLKNVAAFSTLIQKVVERRLDLPGMACFFGPSGLGKTKSAIFGTNRHQGVYVECGQFTTARSLMRNILKENGVRMPTGTITDMIEEAVMIMSSNIRKPLIIDEAHHIAHKKFVDLLRELHDKSLAPIILIGEETLPKQLEAFERVHNRMLDWVRAEPCDAGDFAQLAKFCCPAVKIAPDLAIAVLDRTKGNTRRIVVNFERIEETALQIGKDTLDLADFGGVVRIISSSAPAPRRA